MEPAQITVDCDGDGLADPDGCPKYCEDTTELNCCAAYCPDGFESSKVDTNIDELCTSALGFPFEYQGCIPRDNPKDVDCDGDGVPNHIDCVPCDGSTQTLCADDDRDGYHGNACVSSCETSPPPEGWISSRAPVDCDDMDAKRFRNAIKDEDSDGFSVWVCTGAQTLEREVPSISTERDCDDLDAKVQRTFYADSDGDGYAATSEHGTCVSVNATSTEALRSSPGTDCNDTDPQIRPNQAEWFDDAVDANCDDARESQNCATLDGARGRCGNVTWPKDATCSDSADIVVTGSTWEFITCAQDRGPNELATVSVANAGLLPYEGRLRLRQGANAEDIVGASDNEIFLQVTLVPGEIRIIELSNPYNPFVEVVPEGQPDCHPDNNTATLRIDPIPCE
jgi:hypothetical protein